MSDMKPCDVCGTVVGGYYPESVGRWVCDMCEANGWQGVTVYGHGFSLSTGYASLAAAKRANRARSKRDGLGAYYWEPSAVAFFDSRDEAFLYGRFVIESRQFHGTDGESLPREYVVKVVLDSGAVEPLSDVVHGAFAEAHAEAFAAFDVARFGAMPL